MTSVYSSPKGLPISFTTASLSASGSIAKPISALDSMTLFERSLKFSGKGSVPLLNFPSLLQYIVNTSQPRYSRSNGSASDPAPLTASMTTLNFLFLIDFKSMHDNSIVLMTCLRTQFWSGNTMPIFSDKG